MIQRTAILQPLKDATDPELERDIVSLNFVLDVEITTMRFSCR